MPLDHDRPDGDTITIALSRVRAAQPGRRIGTVLVNPGGPGASGLDFLRGFRFAPEVADRFDVVSWDPRGVGRSQGLRCGDVVTKKFESIDSAPDDPGEQAALDGAAKALADDCGAKDAKVLAHIGTDDTVQDMEAIRRALGEDKLSYYGFSYGTLLGQRYAERFPERVRAMVLDGVVDPAHDLRGLLRSQTEAFKRAMTRVFDTCGDDSVCPDGGAAAAYDRIARRVETEPLPTDTGSALGPSDLATAGIFVAYSPPHWSTLYEGLADGLDGDGSLLAGLADRYRAFGEFTSYLAISCVDSGHPVGPAEHRDFAAELAAISPRFGASIANELLPCAFWPVAPTGQPAAVHAKGAPPTLVIGTTGDAATPYEQAQRVADRLEGARLLTHEGEGHTSYGSSRCIDEAVSRYLVDLDLPPEGTICR